MNKKLREQATKAFKASSCLEQHEIDELFRKMDKEAKAQQEAAAEVEEMIG